MAVTSITDPRSRPGKVTLEGERSYTVTHLVRTDDADDGPNTVMAAAASIGSYYNYGNDADFRAYCVSKSAEQVSSDDGSELKTWIVTCEFKTLSRDDQKKLVTPLNRPYEISYGYEHFSEVVEKDINGGAILNTAGEYFDPPIERDASRPVLTITRNESSFPVSLAFAYADAINSDWFQGASPGTVKVFNIGGQRVIEEFNDSEIMFWKMTYEFHYNPNGWKKKILSQGRSQIVDGDLTPITYPSTSNQVTDPVCLDFDGAAIDPASLPDAAVFVEFDVYNSLPFAAFNF